MGTHVALSRSGARAVRDAYLGYRREFQRLTRLARRRFEQRAWAAGQRDAIARLELYRLTVDEVVGELRRALGESLKDPATWKAMKRAYSELVLSLSDVQLAETFFNSVTRKVHVTVGVDPEIEYVDIDLRRDRYGHTSAVQRVFHRSAGAADCVLRALSSQRFDAPYRDLGDDAELVAAELEESLAAAAGGPARLEAIELVDAVFYRGSGAYLVGRALGAGAALPLVVVLIHGESGIEVDAVLATEREVSIVFSYTRSHFLVDVPRADDAIRFLASIMPRKPLAELYIALGHPKHGKTEMYRDLMSHAARSMERFEHAAGEPGMVMIVFTLRSHDYVFKVIRDRFAPPKTTTRADVLSRYQLVFRHDRAGRLIEAHEFEHLIFERRRFAPALLEELLAGASQSVASQGDEIHIRHLYVERRVRPLDLYLREADSEAADRAVRDYGQALRDLARTNIFPGDLLLKNFGVTRNERVAFYDYDELCLVTDCVFRDLPKPRDAAEELALEPWFYVGERDVFPEELLAFLGFTPRQRQVFLADHAEVMTRAFWRNLQARHEQGEVLDVLPYPPAKRLRARR